MGRDIFQNEFNNVPGEAVLNEQEIALGAAVVEFLERRNSGATVEVDTFVREFPELDGSLREWLTLVTLPEKGANITPNPQQSWEKFRERVFSGETVDSPSLGEYVQQANAAELAKTGLSLEAVEALKGDETPLNTLKGYQLGDYAALARKYGVKDAAFPRMLKWLKNIVAGFSTPAAPTVRGLSFARHRETRQQGLSQAEILEALRKDEPQEGE